jgi:hypothetical protein
VFDIDPIHTLSLVKRMNVGLTYPERPKTVQHKPSNFFAGGGLSF